MIIRILESLMLIIIGGAIGWELTDFVTPKNIEIKMNQRTDCDMCLAKFNCNPKGK